MRLYPMLGQSTMAVTRRLVMKVDPGPALKHFQRLVEPLQVSPFTIKTAPADQDFTNGISLGAKIEVNIVEPLRDSPSGRLTDEYLFSLCSEKMTERQMRGDITNGGLESTDPFRQHYASRGVGSAAVRPFNVTPEDVIRGFDLDIVQGYTTPTWIEAEKKWSMAVTFCGYSPGTVESTIMRETKLTRGALQAARVSLVTRLDRSTRAPCSLVLVRVTGVPHDVQALRQELLERAEGVDRRRLRPSD